MTVADSAAVVAALRRARRRQRVAAIHWVDALYQVYVTGIVAVVAVVLLSGVVGDGRVGDATLADVERHGPALVGLAAALAVLAGLRSGSRGGPLAIERADVRHVLLSPVDRGVALRGPAWRQLRFLVLASGAVGAAVGQLALRRLPGNGAAWLACGAAFGVLVAVLGFGCALVASGARLPGWAATAVGGGLVAWSVADLTSGVPEAPGSVAGRLALWPLGFEPIALVAVAVALVLVAAGMRSVAGTSLEAAERRTALVGQLRFAVTLQDLRTVLVLRRQLAQERPRPRPWFRSRVRRPRLPVLHRGLRSLARWPLGRALRLGVLAVVAGMALRGVWSGTTPLLVLAGVALWVAALDAVEPLGQEVDHPGRTDGYPFPRGHLFLHHLPVVGVVSVVAGLLAGAVAALPGDGSVPVGAALVVGASAGLLAGCGAVVSTVQGAPDAVDVLAMTTPEIAGARTVLRTAWPPAMAVAGALGLLAARAAREPGGAAPEAAAAAVAVPIVLVAALVAGWVRFHDEIHRAIREAAESMSPTKALERAAAEREEAGEGDEAEGPAPDDDDDTAAAPPAAPAGGRARAQRSRPAPRRRPDTGPEPGSRGGSSPKPIGRRRDQA